MTDNIYFITDVQTPSQLTDLLNNPASISILDESSLAGVGAVETRRSGSIKDLFRKSKTLAKRKWPSHPDALRKVVLYSKCQKAHYEICKGDDAQWRLGNMIEEVYVRSLKTLRVVPWLQSLYMPKGDKKKKSGKKKDKKKKNKPPLFGKRAKSVPSLAQQQQRPQSSDSSHAPSASSHHSVLDQKVRPHSASIRETPQMPMDPTNRAVTV